MEWREVWRDPEWSKPSDDNSVIVRTRNSTVLNAKWDGGKFFRYTKEGAVEVEGVTGWIPYPLDDSKTRSNDIPVEVVFPYMARENRELRENIDNLLEIIRQQKEEIERLKVVNRKISKSCKALKKVSQVSQQMAALTGKLSKIQDLTNSVENFMQNIDNE